jgi:NAD+--dinitrogen-reductase ADP-D-ribosyltransferase
MDSYITNTNPEGRPLPSLPRNARLPINRCNLPAVILGSVTFHRHPVPLVLDGIAELHADLFRRLDKLHNAVVRARHFMDYVTVHFRLEALEDAGLTPEAKRARPKADYLHMMRGWAFDPDGREGAVLKGWVESRFGLLARHHGGPLGDDPGGERELAYLEARTRGLYNTNALEAQFDLLYTYCQYELSRRYPALTRLRLYRGVNRLDEHEVLEETEDGTLIVVMNSLSSFTSSRDRAGEFGDYVLEADVPLAKIMFFDDLLPKVLRSEQEYAAIGGIYEVTVSGP